MKLTRPAEARNGDASAHDDEAAERDAPEGAIDVPRPRLEHQPGLGMDERRAAAPEDDEKERQDSEQRVRSGAPAKHRRTMAFAAPERTGRAPRTARHAKRLQARE